MSIPPFDLDWPVPALEAFLLGQIKFDEAVTLQRRIVEESRKRGDGQVTLLLCEHPAMITIGRGGSPGDVAMHNHLVRDQQLPVRWVNRGGGALVHCPGQLAVYPIVPLGWHQFSIGQFLDRLRSGLVNGLRDVHPSILPEPRTPDFPAESSGAIYGRTGQLAALGIAVRHWITYYGAYVNVCVPAGLFRLVRASPGSLASMSCLAAERCGPVKMTALRAALVHHLAGSFGCDRYHLYTGHPLLHATGKCDTH